MPAYIHSDRGSSFMSGELKSFLTSQGIATSRTTPYNPQGNGQAERYNGIIWKTIQLSLKSNEMKTEQWEEVIQTALHSIRSLLCTATNTTPHERMFSHPRRSSNGCSIPTWLSQPGPILMRNHARTNKYQPLVQEVELIEANPDYAHVRFPDGRESTVSTRHLAPRGDSFTTLDEEVVDDPENDCFLPPTIPQNVDIHDSHETYEVPTARKDYVSQRPVRQRRLPAYLTDYVTN